MSTEYSNFVYIFFIINSKWWLLKGLKIYIIIKFYGKTIIEIQIQGEKILHIWLLRDNFLVYFLFQFLNFISALYTVFVDNHENDQISQCFLVFFVH